MAAARHLAVLPPVAIWPQILLSKRAAASAGSFAWAMVLST